jgi:GTP diphosphokinase / guanosine-3',5'-bis(diphosphate) 3'-diphosphatase
MEYLFEFDLVYDEDMPFGKSPQEDLDYFMNEVRKKNAGLDEEIIKKAFWYCHEMHETKTRASGYPYYTHPLSTALILLNEFSIIDTQLIASAFLHDVIEDVLTVKKHHVTELFGKEIADIVDGVTKISHEKLESERVTIKSQNLNKSKEKSETYRKLFIALVKDVRVIMIKLADRLHNLRTLHYLKKEKQKSIALETLSFYVPLAHRLGLNRIKMELENRSFYYSAPGEYESIRKELNEKRRDFIDYIKVFIDLIHTSLNNNHLSHVITVVHKHEYEIKKMTEEGKSISDIDNFYSVVIVLDTDDVHECYRAHGVLANAFNAVSFMDYISHPKIDWYKSLNTELYGPDGKRVEILIRNREMEKLAEEGFASRYTLKDGRIRALEFGDEEIENWSNWMGDMIDSHGENATQIIWDSIKVNLFDNELTVYTKEGQPVRLPQGASILDYAFAVGIDVGLHCVTGKVNGVIQDISYKLKSGDQVEIINSQNVFPKTDWEDYVVTHRAVVNLHLYFRKNPPIVNQKLEKKENFEVRLDVKGEDRTNMLGDITNAIGKSYIRRINLDTSEHIFEGAITIEISNNDELNRIFTRLLSIKGIRSVVRVKEN